MRPQRKTSLLFIVPLFTSKGRSFIYMMLRARVRSARRKLGENTTTRSARLAQSYPSPSLPYLRPLCYATELFCYLPPPLCQIEKVSHKLSGCRLDKIQRITKIHTQKRDGERYSGQTESCVCPRNVCWPGRTSQPFSKAGPLLYSN